MKYIESIRNPDIQFLRTLRKPRDRHEQGLYLIEGPRMAETALEFGVLSGVYISRFTERNSAVTEAAEASGIPVTQVSEAVMDCIAETKTPQGIVCVCRMAQQPAGLRGRLILALDAVQNPGNVGTMIRTADAAGFDGVLLGAGCADIYGPKTLAATMGSLFHLDILQVPDLAKVLLEYREKGYAVIATELGGEDFYWECPAAPAILTIGNEGNGISQEVSAAATHHLALPMRGHAESLNASVAAGIMIYEIARKENSAED